ncbi:MAG TPA: hypothetical protein VF148_14040 [Acidimicrobiia bacterium]
MAWRETPTGIPVLSRGKHRTPRKGACFMEYASFLAGERWTDHPRCTHPLLAGVARSVNDHISDTARPRLVALTPSVIGLTGDDPRVDAGIAIRCAATALPVVAEHRQRALAAGLISARRLLAQLEADEPSGFDLTDVLDQAEAALSRTPQAASWAREFTAETRLTSRALQKQSAPCIVRVAVVGIAEACISDPDTLLYELLDTVVRDCTAWLGAGPSHTVSDELDLADTVLWPARTQ